MNLLSRPEPVGDAALTEAADGSLTLRAPAGGVGGGATFTFEGPARDWSAGRSAAFTLRANGAHRLQCCIEHGRGHWLFYLVPRPGLTSRIVLKFADLQERPPNQSCPGYSAFGGGPAPVDLQDVRSLTVTFNQVSPQDKELTLADLAVHDEPLEPVVLDPRVVVDGWGQWTGERGEPRTAEQIRAAWAAEPAVFDGFPGQTDETGADAGSAPAEATGFFRAAQEGGRWRLIDPSGRPFFSVGSDCVRSGSEGPVGGREALFADLSDARWSGHEGGNVRWTNPRWADFYNLNLRRRHGEEGWRDAWSERTVARLRRWGFNTIANWSDTDLTRRGRMPYTTNITALSEMCGHLPDVYAPDFARRVRRLVEPEVSPFRGDRMLIGFFVGNEPRWTFGGHRHPFNDVFTAEEYPHTRARALDWVRQSYRGDLAAVNAAWGTDAAAWEDLTRPAGIPDVRLGADALKRDADAFMGEVLGTFYDTCCAAIRAVDPDHLLLGGRFYTARMAEPYVRACRAFDVYSFNCYQWDPPAEDIERVTRLSGLPVLIGEFHYGVEGRGLTASLVGVSSQEERGLAYRHFVEGAAALPSVVGLHWFQWADQPCTGRFDGECYNIGLVDVTDLPYEAFLNHVRETHGRLYAVCQGEAAPYSYPGQRPPAW